MQIILIVTILSSIRTFTTFYKYVQIFCWDQVLMGTSRRGSRNQSHLRQKMRGSRATEKGRRKEGMRGDMGGQGALTNRFAHFTSPALGQIQRRPDWPAIMITVSQTHQPEWKIVEWGRKPLQEGLHDWLREGQTEIEATTTWHTNEVMLCKNTICGTDFR